MLVRNDEWVRKQRKEEGTKGRSEGKKRRNERTKEWESDGTKERGNGGAKERTNERRNKQTEGRKDRGIIELKLKSLTLHKDWHHWHEIYRSLEQLDFLRCCQVHWLIPENKIRFQSFALVLVSAELFSFTNLWIHFYLVTGLKFFFTYVAKLVHQALSLAGCVFKAELTVCTEFPP